MDIPLPDQASGRPAFVSRRQLLRLAGSAGLAAAGSSCSIRTAERHTAAPTGDPRSAASAPTTESRFETNPPEPPRPTPSAAASAVLLCRDAWGARPARAGGKPHTITRMTIHHSGVALGDNRTITDRLRRHQQYHQDQQGWIDIAYHVGIDRDGNIFELRNPELAGDTATDYDPTGHFLVLCEGDFDQETVPEAQLGAAALTFAWAAQNFGITADTLASHRDVAPATVCPGANLYQHVTSGELERRIDDLLAAGPVNLQHVCGPEADAIVAGIQAG